MGTISQNDDWPSPKTDANICTVLTFLSVLLGGLGLYLTSKQWQSFPLILIALILWGVSCIGIRNLVQQTKNDP